jgi:hypothetical protein
MNTIYKKILRLVYTLGILTFIAAPILTTHSQIELPDTCPEGEECPVVGEDRPNSTESLILEEIEPSNDDQILLGILSFVSFITIALSVLISPILIVVGIVLIVKKKKGWGIFCLIIGPLLFIGSILGYTIISIISNLIGGSIID